MEFLKKLMMWLGGLFTLIVILIIFLAAGSSSFKDEQEPFVQQFMADFSERWETQDIYARLSNEFIEQ
ncbi:MAG: preprotein translocase subunit SecG, partial [Colwellia sp.]